MRRRGVVGWRERLKDGRGSYDFNDDPYIRDGKERDQTSKGGIYLYAYCTHTDRCYGTCVQSHKAPLLYSTAIQKTCTIQNHDSIQTEPNLRLPTPSFMQKSIQPIHIRQSPSSPPPPSSHHTYLLSGSNLSIKSILFSYIVNTIPPLNINLTSLGNAPLQNVNNPSFFAISAAHAKLFLYRLLASILCMRVLIVSSGCVTYTVIKPAMPPIPNVAAVPNFSPGAVYDCASWRRKVYDPKRVALLAACRAVVGTKPWKKPRRPRSRAMMGTAWRKPRIRGLAALRSSILILLDLKE